MTHLDDLTCKPVPEQSSGQFSIAHELQVTPYTPAWWVTQNITQIPNDSIGWLLAQGWQIVGNPTFDNTTVPPTPYYDMTRQSLQNWIILQSLLEEYTRAKNVADTNNTTRYNDIVSSWSEMLETSHDQFEFQSAERESYATLYLGNLDTYMNEVDTLIDFNQFELNKLEPEYTTHTGVANAFLVGLGATDLARINEEFAASLAVQLQLLTDRGLYSSAVAVDITARSDRDRDEQIQALNDRLMREKLTNQHQVYGQQVTMRGMLAEHRHRAILEKMNESVQRLAGITSTHEECMRLMAYQLDERNKILIGLYGFVERRDDVPPSFESLTQLATGLGDAGGGWVTP